MNQELALLIERVSTSYFWIFTIIMIMRGIQIFGESESYLNEKKADLKRIENGTYKMQGISLYVILVYTFYILSIYYM